LADAKHAASGIKAEGAMFWLELLDVETEVKLESEREVGVYVRDEHMKPERVADDKNVIKK
jgi:hypothetical protein